MARDDDGFATFDLVEQLGKVGLGLGGLDTASGDPLPARRLVARVELAQLRLQPIMLGYHGGEPVDLLSRRFGFTARPINRGDRLAQPVTCRRQRVGSRISSGERERVKRGHRVMVLRENRQWCHAQRRSPVRGLLSEVTKGLIMLVIGGLACPTGLAIIGL